MSAAQPLIQAGLLGEALDGGPVAVLVADEHMRYFAVNAYACELLGYTRDELLDLSVTDVARYPEAEAEFEQMLEGGRRRGRTTLTRKDGSTFAFSYVAGETTVAGLPLYVSVGFPLEDD